MGNSFAEYDARARHILLLNMTVKLEDPMRAPFNSPPNHIFRAATLDTLHRGSATLVAFRAGEIRRGSARMLEAQTPARCSEIQGASGRNTRLVDARMRATSEHPATPVREGAPELVGDIHAAFINAAAHRAGESCPRGGKKRRRCLQRPSSRSRIRHRANQAAESDAGHRSKSRNRVSNLQTSGPKRGKAFPKE